MPIHIQTPYVESHVLSRRATKSVWLKLELLQPSGSFKARGIGHACETFVKRGAKRFISSSGGNAGLATAYAGRKLSVPVVVVVPESTSARSKELIASEHAEVIVHGPSWTEANELAQSMLTHQDAFIHPFDDPLLWDGHASMIDEMAAIGPKPDAIILSVGGGGLLCGVIEGLWRNNWQDVNVIAVETRGADSFAQALAAGHLVTLPSIDSIATCLGARTVSAQALNLAQKHAVENVVVTDAQAVGACMQMLDDHRLVVEPACGASLAALQSASTLLKKANLVSVIVCGGVGATVQQLQDWAAIV